MKSCKFLSLAAVLVLILSQGSLATALDDYIAAPDDSYKFELVNTVSGPGYTAYILDMTSQTWRKPHEVDRTEWRHWLTIVRPQGELANTGLLWITGGSNGGKPPRSVEGMLVQVALGSKSVVAELRMVPNQPLVFPDDGRRRYEDAIIAYTYDKYMKTGDGTWPLLLPMAKSAVRAMDTVQSWLKTLKKDAIDIQKFVVSGASKRGWTTWLTAAVDKRVTAIVPAVINVLNMDEQMKHHYSAYGFYAPAIHDYEEMKIFERLGTKEGDELLKIVDPYEYRQRYTMPKYTINSPGDQFFLPDSDQFYFKDLPGQKYLRYVPNTEHGLDGSDALQSLLVFYQSILAGRQRPEFTWTVGEDGSIEVHTSTAPAAVNLWQATNSKARDFRLMTIGKVWKSTPLSPEGPGKYVVKMAEPEEGWTAFFIELTFESGLGIPFKFTTECSVVPKSLPFAHKAGSDSLGGGAFHNGLARVAADEPDRAGAHAFTYINRNAQTIRPRTR